MKLLSEKENIYVIIACGLWLLLTAFSAVAQISFDSIENNNETELATVTPYFSYSSAEPGKTYKAAVVVEIMPQWHINSSRPFQDYLIPAQLIVDTSTGIIVNEIVYPQAHEIDLLGEKMSVYSGRAVIYFDVEISSTVSADQIELPLTFKYQACNDKECRAPVAVNLSLPIKIGLDGTPVNTTVFNQPSQTELTAENQETAIQDTTDLERLINKYGFWGYFMALGLAFLTGVLLSFSPCTYPMIPITVSIFAGQERSLGRGFILSLFYVGSMAIVYGIMGLVVSLIGGVFGAWLASPPVVIGIAAIFVIFSLSMFGLYELQVPAFLRSKLGAAQTRGGVAGTIILGIIAALVVSPCVGPFVAGILLYIATYGSPLFGFITLFVFAFGLGTLYILIGTFSSAISALPGAGMWMESVKKFFGFVLLIMALYFLRTIISADLLAILLGFLLIAFAVFGGGLDRLSADSKLFDRLKKFLGIIALLLGIYFLLGTILISGFILPSVSQWLPVGGGQVPSLSDEKLIDWQTDLESGLALAKESRRPVLIDTWATWCANCRVLEKITFSNIEVAREAKRFVALKIQLEKNDSPESIAFMNRFGLKHYSLPTTLLLDSDGHVKKIIQGVIKPEDLIPEMKKIQ